MLLMMLHALCSDHVNNAGGLDIKILPRTAKLDGVAVKSGPPPEQDIPLDIPKRTALYVEQVKRPPCNVSSSICLHNEATSCCAACTPLVACTLAQDAAEAHKTPAWQSDCCTRCPELCLALHMHVLHLCMPSDALHSPTHTSNRCNVRHACLSQLQTCHAVVTCRLSGRRPTRWTCTPPSNRSWSSCASRLPKPTTKSSQMARFAALSICHSE